MNTIINSNSLSKSILIIQMSEIMADRYLDGDKVYIGKSKIYKIPIYIDLERFINPHISIIGTTGSGKTHLTKNIIVGHRLKMGYNIIIIDWSGEYNKIVEFINGNIYVIRNESTVEDLPKHMISGTGSGAISIDLSKLESQTEKQKFAKAAVDIILSDMYNSGPKAKLTNMLILDESWKFLGTDSELGKLFREGRKYGLSVVVSSQLVTDIKNEIMSNSACFFIFKIENMSDISILRGSGIISEENPSDLKRGSCIISISKQESSTINHFVIDNIDPFTIDAYNIKCGSMLVNISKEKFLQMIDKYVNNAEKRNDILLFIERNKDRADLSALIRIMEECGTDTPGIISALSELGIDVLSIIDAIGYNKGVAVNA